MYDYLIVGAGLFGSVFAHEMTKKGNACLVIDKRPHIGGNVYCSNCNGIHVHEYGAHIFHTNDKRTWDYMQQFTSFNHYINSPLANYKGELYNLPFNMNTFYQLWKVKTPDEAKQKIAEQIAELECENPGNLEEQAIKLVGRDIYEKLIKEYTHKQWGKPCTELPPFIIKRLPVRFTYNNNYFNDRYQGIPIGGYTPIIEQLLAGIDVRTQTDYFTDRQALHAVAKKMIFTGSIDEFFDYRFGELEYRALRFEHETLDCSNYQGNAVINYTDMETPYTRTIEHKHFEFGTQPHTVVTKEYPLAWQKGLERYYPINDTRNNTLYEKYKELAQTMPNVLFGGRLADYTYYDMNQVVEKALNLAASN